MKSVERASPSLAKSDHRGTPERRVADPSELAGALHEVSNALTVVLGWLDDARTLAERPDVRDVANLQRALGVAYQHARRGHDVARRAIGARVDAEEGARSAELVAADALLSVAQQAAVRNVRLYGPDSPQPLDSPRPAAGTAAGSAEPAEATRAGASAQTSTLHSLPASCGPSLQHGLVEQPGAVLQILINLLLNALAFSPPGGCAEVRLEVGDNWVSFFVEDEGPGVPVEMRENLFAAPTSQRAGGAGIGLTQSAALAREHGGVLRLSTSSKRRGACFELTWPLAEPRSRIVVAEGALPVVADSTEVWTEAALQWAATESDGVTEDRVSGPPTEPSWAMPVDERVSSTGLSSSAVSSSAVSSSSVSSSAGRKLQGMRVLLLEDDRAVLEMVHFGLLSRGVEVSVATTAAELVRLLSTGARFDAALVDLSPIGEDPRRALSELVRPGTEVPIILISGSVAPNIRELPLAGWVHKPFALNELYDALSALDGL